MKRIVIAVLAFIGVSQMQAQNNATLLKHYEAYYKQMRTQGDVQGVINALTHLNVLDKNQARIDTLAILYMNKGSHLQALNTIGYEVNAADSDMAVEVKAVSLKAINQPEKALPHFEKLFKKQPSAYLAYELADLKIQTGDLTGANLNISFGIANSTPKIMRTFYEAQQPYQVPMKAAFTYLKSLAKFKENPTANIDAAIALLDEALVMAPNFNLAYISKEALKAQKTQGGKN